MSTLSKAVAVFAHNEGRDIVTCLDSIQLATESNDLECYVLANGCTDDTVSLVAQYAENHPFVNLVEIAEGDKANAWNVFIHELAPQADNYFFVDGDCTPMAKALDNLEHCLVKHGDANAATSVPLDIGRGTKQQIEDMEQDGGLAGGLYALSGEFVDRIRRDGVYLPFGLIGDDSLVGALAHWTLDPRQAWDRSKIIVCKNACFGYVPLSAFSLRDLKLYYRRKKRYSTRYFQNKLIQKVLKESGVASIPKHVSDLYGVDFSLLKLQWRGVDTYFDWLALRSIKVEAKI